jgi:hypothetical protein
LLHALCGQGDAGIGLLTLVGAWNWWGVWSRRDTQPLTAVALCILATTALHLWYAQQIEGRHLFPILLLGLPFAGLGWLKGCASLRLLLAPWQPSWVMVIGSTLVVLTALGWGDGLGCPVRSRGCDVALGQWVLAEWGPGRRLGHSQPGKQLEYYARGEGFRLPADDDAAAGQLQALQLDLVIVRPKDYSADGLQRFLCRAQQLGYRALDRSQFPPGHDWNDYLVLRSSTQTPGEGPGR